MMSLAGTFSRSASWATVEPCGTLMVSSCERSWSFAMAASMRASLAASACCFFLRSLRLRRLPVDSSEASRTASRASSSTRSRL